MCSSVPPPHPWSRGHDSPALKKADIGIAMGIAGSDAAKNAADMILLDDNFASIVTGVEEGPLIFDNLKKTIAYTLTKNTAELCPFLIYIIVGLPLPIGTITILVIDLGTDIIPSIALAYEKAESDIMNRKPHYKKKDRLVNQQLTIYSYLHIGLMQAVGAFIVYFTVYAQEGFKPSVLINIRVEWENSNVNDLEDSYGQQWTSHQYLEWMGYTAFFVGIMVQQIADLIIRKIRRNSIFQQGIFRNKVTWVRIASQIIIALILSCGLGSVTALSFTMLWPQYWFVALPFAILIGCMMRRGNFSSDSTLEAGGIRTCIIKTSSLSKSPSCTMGMFIFWLHLGDCCNRDLPKCRKRRQKTA